MNAELSPHSISKQAIARSFSAVATTYDESAELQRQVVDAMMPCVNSEETVHTILNIGSGTGYCSQQLKEKFPQATIINLDIAEAMLSFSKGKLGEKQTQFLCADAENIPLHSESVDMIFSSLAIQWCQNYSQLFSELHRVVKKSGKIYLTTFGPGTLQEVKELWSEIDNGVHVNSFSSAAQLLREARLTGLYMNHFVCDYYHRYYQSFTDLARELKGIGASNKNSGQLKGLTGKGVIQRIEKAFERHKTDQGMLVSYEVINLEFVKEQ